MTSQGMPF